MDKLWKLLTDFWVLFGIGGQIIFAGAFVIQWLASERRKRSHVPVSFWYVRILGSAILFAVALKLLLGGEGRAVVFVLGYSLNVLIYVRNLMLIHRRRAAGVPAGPEEDD
ncbi:MAG TPA: lipid-A-disaccharide synthase N-terminal domain-containing protein [Planctomycetota bacterium]|nr:lipid-A-disaccharide synthase N-terminal domain-containing protein [Planctomycetota bacterium]